MRKNVPKLNILITFYDVKEISSVGINHKRRFVKTIIVYERGGESALI